MNKLLVSILFLAIGFSAWSQKQTATIIFEGERFENSRTYLCKLKKGDPYRLNDYLQSGTNDQTDKQNIEAEFAPRSYEPKADRSETRYLSEIYNVNEKKLKKGKQKQRQKYFEEKEKAYLEKRQLPQKKEKKKPVLKDIFSNKKSETKLARQFKFSERRIRKNQKRNFPPGNINLIIKYKVRENNTVLSYVTSLQYRLEPGKTYYLSYYGNSTQRKYYLKTAPGN